MRRPSFVALLAAMLSLQALPCLAQGNSGVTLTFSANAVTAAGITPGKSAVFFASGLMPDGAQQGVVRWSQIVSDDDRDGRVTLTMTNRIPSVTIWAVVDLTNGQFGVGSPGGFAPRVTRLVPGAFRRSGGSAAVDLFGFDHPVLDLLYVFPGKGAWTWNAVDGRAPFDRDGANGVTLVSVADAKPLGDANGKPSEFAAGGVLIAIDWYHMEVVTVRVDAAVLGGGH
jgi:hypothetical protein